MPNDEPFKDLAYGPAPWSGELKAEGRGISKEELRAGFEAILNAPARIEPRARLISTIQYGRLTAGCKRCGTHEDLAWLIYNPELLCLNCDDSLTDEQKILLLFSA